MKDFKSVLLALLSVGLIATWFFHFYEKSHYKTDTQKTYIRDSATIAQIIKDVLKDSIKKTNPDLSNIEPKDSSDPHVDTLESRLNNSLNEVITLKKEIDDILKNSEATQSDLARSRSLIGDLNNKIEKLKSENKSLQVKKLQANTNQQITVTKPIETETISQRRTPRRKDSMFIASDINLYAVAASGEDKESITSANEPGKIVFSFKLRNNILEDLYYDIYVVIIDPGNKVLQTDEWAAAENFFASKKEGKRAFTKRIRFEYKGNESKKIIGSIEPGKTLKGLYALKIYYNGILIGLIKRRLD